MRTTWKPFSKKTKLIFLLSLTFLFLFSGSVYAETNKYSCNVIKFQTNDTDTPDPKFIESNLQKKFLITVDEKNIFLTSISSNFSTSQAIYRIIYRGGAGIFSISSNAGTLDSLVFDKISGNGSIVIQHNFFANVWLIRCHKI